MSERQHPLSRSFDRVADLYERSRPGYPDDAVGWLVDRLGIERGRTVLDLGAGTGKLTRQLVRTGARVIALEPGDEMRAQLERVVPEAEPLAAGAEDIPLEANSVDAVTAAQSFHWFRFDESIREIKRVWRPNGGLGLVWNERDPEDPLQQRVTELTDPFVPGTRPRRGVDAGWRAWIEASGLFGPLEQCEVRFAQELDADEFVDRVATISFVVSAAPRDREELARELRLLAHAGGGWVVFRYVTQAYVTFSVA
jgi:ubiquinone/menaquinone biosynthesis C-methylase UbiE